MQSHVKLQPFHNRDSHVQWTCWIQIEFSFTPLSHQNDNECSSCQRLISHHVCWQWLYHYLWWNSSLHIFTFTAHFISTSASNYLWFLSTWIQLFILFTTFISLLPYFHCLHCFVFFAFLASMTLQCMFSDDDLTLLSNNSEYESFLTLTILICLLIYTTSSVASAVRSVKNVLLNKNHYTKQILKGYNLKHIQLLFWFNIFNNSSLPQEVLQTQWTVILDTFLFKLNQSGHSDRDVSSLNVNKKVERIKCYLHFSLWHWMPSHLWILKDTMNDKEIAIIINYTSASVFRQIQFSNFVQQVFLDFHKPLNFTERLRKSIWGFLLWHTKLKNLLYLHLNSHSSEVQKYKLVVTVLWRQKRQIIRKGKREG